MKWSISISFYLFVMNICTSQPCTKWVVGYLPTYQQDLNGHISFMEDSDYAKLTHVAHLGPYVNSDGSLNMGSNGATHVRMIEAVLATHNHNVPILLSFQAWFTDYLPAIQNETSRAALVNNILNLLDTYGYDGLDVDLEPIMSPWVAGIQVDNPEYISLINTLYDSLQIRTSVFLGSAPLLTVAANGYAGPVLASLQNKFDMINLLTYDLAGVYPGWVTWHDSPVYHGGNVMPSTGQYMPSVNGEVQQCISAGVLPSKLGVGISMDAFRWRGGTGTPTGGVTAPMQAYTTDPTWTRLSYAEFYNNYYSPTNYEYDSDAKMSYLSVDNSDSANDEFWSYNDQYSCIDKVNYVWSNELGGHMIWELKSGYISSNPIGTKIPQLNYIYNENCAQASVLAIDDVIELNCSSQPAYNLLTWISVSEYDIIKYTIETSKNGKDWYEIAQIQPNGSYAEYEYRDKNIEFGNQYYRILASTNTGSNHYSNIALANNTNLVSIYPNPMFDKLFINTPQNYNFHVKVFDSNGNHILATRQTNEIDVKNLEIGLYFIQIYTETQNYIYKLVKI